MRRMWLGIWISLCGAMSLHPTMAATVVVMDFTTPADDASLAWAQLGVPDLLGVELAACGWEVVDRESLEPVILEASLSDNIQAGCLVGAEYVVSGRVSCPEPGHLLIEGALTKVEGLETVRSVSRAGACPKELGEIIQTLAREVSVVVGARNGQASDRVEVWFPKPEALIFFYRGLSAYSAGYPEAAAAWFISANRMDTNFVAAMAWEIRAFETSGFPEMGELARKQHGQQWEGLNTSEDKEMRTLALARPLLAPADAWTAEQTLELMNTLSAALSQRKNIRLLNPGALERAIREQDTQLNGLFSGATTARYGRWHIPDGILQCRITRTEGSAKIQLGVDALTTGGSIVHEEGAVPMVDMGGGLRQLVERLLSRWELEQDSAESSEFQPATTTIPESALEGLSGQYRDLALKLNQLRQAGGIEEWNALIEAFRQIDYGPLGGLAIDCAIQHIDLDAHGADIVLQNKWRDLFAPYQMPPSHVHYASSAVLASLETNLLTRFPNSICTGALWYEKGRIAWCAERLEEAVECMGKALGLLAPGRSETEDRVILAALFIQAESLRRRGSEGDAQSLYKAAQQHISRCSMKTSGLPRSLFVLDDRQIWIVQGEEELVTRVNEAVRRYEEGDVPLPTPIDRLMPYVERYKKGIALDDALRGFIVPAMNALIEVWLITGSFQIENSTDVNLARNWLSLLAQAVSVEERREWLPKFLEAYLHSRGEASAGSFAQMELSGLLPHVSNLWLFFNQVGLRPEGLDFIDRFLAPGTSPDMAFQVLAQVDVEPSDKDFSNHGPPLADLEAAEWAPRLLKLAERMPGGERDIPGSLWMHLALLSADGKDWDGAAAAMSKGLASAQPGSPDEVTARILFHHVLKRRSEDPHTAVKAKCAEMGLLPWIPRWWQWYNEGLRAEANGEPDVAIACYQVFLRYLDAPQEMDPTLQIIAPTMFEPRHVRQGDDCDWVWFSDQVNRRNSAKFRMALSFLGLHQPNQAATLLREVALEVGQDMACLNGKYARNGFGGDGFHLGVVASALLHSLHLLNEIQESDMPMLDRGEVARQCEAAGRDLLRVDLKNESQFFFEAADRLKSP